MTDRFETIIELENVSQIKSEKVRRIKTEKCSSTKKLVSTMELESVK